MCRKAHDHNMWEKKQLNKTCRDIAQMYYSDSEVYNISEGEL